MSNIRNYSCCNEKKKCTSPVLVLGNLDDPDAILPCPALEIKADQNPGSQSSDKVPGLHWTEWNEGSKKQKGLFQTNFLRTFFRKEKTVEKSVTFVARRRKRTGNAKSECGQVSRKKFLLGGLFGAKGTQVVKESVWFSPVVASFLIALQKISLGNVGHLML